jgi:FAD dependent oxidoreductase TIGR03364
MKTYDLAVVGAGIVGLAHALAALRRGMRVAVVERDARASQASIRNFGFVTVSGQAEGVVRSRTLRSRATWIEVAREAGIPLLQRGAVVAALREEALAVLREFADGPMGEGCELWDAARATREAPMLSADVRGALWSPHELRVEAREALPRLAAWLASQGVDFFWGSAAFAFDDAGLRCAGGLVPAKWTVFAPGAEAASLFPDVARSAGMKRCKLQMMRIAPQRWRMPAVAMADLSLVRYAGFAAQPSAASLRARLERESPEAIAHGVHLIVAQSADGSLVVGDSHAYDDADDPFASAQVERLLMAQLRALVRLDVDEVRERWIGYYPVCDATPLVVEPVGPRARLVVVTSGTGMSSAFAIAEETLDSLLGVAA